MTQIKKLKNSQGVQVYPQTHTKAVIDDNGNSVESVLQAQTDIINAKQFEQGDVEWDIYPTAGSYGKVASSGGVFDSLHTQKTIDLSALTLKNFYVNSSNVWERSTNYCGKFLPVNEGDVYTLTPPSDSAVVISIVKSTSQTDGSAPDFSASFPSRIIHATGESYTVTIPSDAHYIWIRTKNSGTDTIPTVVGKVERYAIASEVNADIESLQGTVLSEPIAFAFANMTQNRAIISPSTHNWRADNTYYQHYYFEKASNMKKIAIEGNGSTTSYISFLKTYNYEGTPTGTPDYCDGYNAPVAFASTSTPQNSVAIPDDCNYIVVNKSYYGAVQLPSAVFIEYNLKSVAAYRNDNKASYPVPMEVGYISLNNGGNSPYSKDADNDNGYAYSSTDGKFHQWRSIGMIEVNDGDYTLSFDKGDVCIGNYYDTNRNLIKRVTHNIIDGSCTISVNGVKYIRIEVYTESETYEQDGTLESMYEPNVIINGIFNGGFKISKLKKQRSTQADTIVVPVWIEDVFCSIDTTQSVQDNGGWHIDFGRIALPPNYNPDGEPVRLIIYSHGGQPRYNPVFNGDANYKYTADAFYNNSHIDPTLFLKEGYAVMDMDACFCIFNTKDIDGVRVIDGKQVANCYQAAYDFVIRNYNIKTDGVLLGGISFGAHRCLQMIMWSNIPILAAAFHSPFVGEHKLWYVSHRLTLAKSAGFTNYDDVTIGDLDTTQLALLEENYPKLLRTSPMLAMCHPSKEEFFSTKSVEIEGQTVDVSLINGYKNFGIYVVSTWAAHFPVPIKMWAGTADTTAQPDEHAEVLYNVGINGGSDIEIRIVNGAKHVPTVGDDIITIPSYTTKYGETITNVSMIYVETLRYWRRYEQK